MIEREALLSDDRLCVLSVDRETGERDEFAWHDRFSELKIDATYFAF